MGIIKKLILWNINYNNDNLFRICMKFYVYIDLNL